MSHKEQKNFKHLLVERNYHEVCLAVGPDTFRWILTQISIVWLWEAIDLYNNSKINSIHSYKKKKHFFYNLIFLKKLKKHSREQ